MNNKILFRDHSRTIDNAEIFKLNERLKMLTSENVQYVDLSSPFMAEGTLSPEFTNDGIHLNGDGYLIWIEIIKSLI